MSCQLEERRQIRQTNRILVCSSLPKTGVSITLVTFSRWEGPATSTEMVTPYETQASVQGMVSRDARPFCRNNRRTPLALGEEMNARQRYSSQHRITDVVQPTDFPIGTKSPQPGPLIVYLGSNSGGARHAKKCFYLGFHKEIRDHIATEVTPFLPTKSFLTYEEKFLLNHHKTRKNHLWLGHFSQANTASTRHNLDRAAYTVPTLA